jgi:hypothetical protein
MSIRQVPHFVLLAITALLLASLLFASDAVDGAATDAKPTPTPKKTKPPKDDPDKELDDILNEDKNNPGTPNTKTGTTTTDELGDLDDEIELEGKPDPKTKPPAGKKTDPDTPTHEVPADIKKNTGQVKVPRYAVYVITNASNGLFVGTEDEIKGKMSCDFVGGGPRGCKAPPATYLRLSDARLTRDLAQQDLCNGISETRIFPLGIGLKGKWTDDKWYGLWDASVDGCKKPEGTPK